jgi:integration host factor subunit beta
MATITKKDLVERISEQTEQTQVMTKKIIQGFLDAIVEELAAGNRIEFREFGVFETRERRSRRARNPRTGEDVPVNAKTVVTFKAGRLMKARVQELERARQMHLAAEARAAEGGSGARVTRHAPPTPDRDVPGSARSTTPGN